MWIVLLGSTNREVGYNTTFGGRYGGKPTDEVKAKIGLASSQRRHSEETRKQMSEKRTGSGNSFYGKHHKPESLEVMKEKLKVALGGENNPWFGKLLTSAHRLNISRAKQGKTPPPCSEETRRKLSEAATARWARYRSEKGSIYQIEKEAACA